MKEKKLKEVDFSKLKKQHEELHPLIEQIKIRVEWEKLRPFFLD